MTGQRPLLLVVDDEQGILAVLSRFASRAGFDVVGLDTYLFNECTFGPDIPDIPAIRKDVRDVEVADLEGFADRAERPAERPRRAQGRVHERGSHGDHTRPRGHTVEPTRHDATGWTPTSGTG